MTNRTDPRADQLAKLEAATKRLDEIRNQPNRETLATELARLDRRVQLSTELDDLFREAKGKLNELARLDAESWSDLSSSNLPRGLNTVRRAKNRAACVVAHLSDLGSFFNGARVPTLGSFSDLAASYLSELERGLNSAASQEEDDAA